MKNKANKHSNLFFVTVFAFLFSSCAQETNYMTNFVYNKNSEEMLRFESSNKDLDFFLNDYFKRHTGVIEDGVDQKVTSVVAGKDAGEIYWQDWMTSSYYYFNSFDGMDVDRIEGLRKLLSNIPIDRYGYVWQRTDEVRNSLSTYEKGGEQRMGWPFPTTYDSGGRNVSWDFNGEDDTNWTTNASNLKLANGLMTSTLIGQSNSLEFISPNQRKCEIVAYHCPLLELDVRIKSNGYLNNLDDIYVWYKTEKSNFWSEDKCVSVKNNAFISYDIKESDIEYEHLIMLPMYSQEQWNCDLDESSIITQLKVEFRPKTGLKLFGDYSLSYVRSTYDTRHINNNSIFISSLRKDFDFTGDIDYLKKNITRARKAMGLMLQMDDKNDNRDLIKSNYFVGHEGTKTYLDYDESESSKSVSRMSRSIGNGYWDIAFMPNYDFQTNMYYFKALTDMAYLESVLEGKSININKNDAKLMTATRTFENSYSSYNEDSNTLKNKASKVLNELRKETNESDGTGFFSNKNGRFTAGYAPECTKTDGVFKYKFYDYGYVMWNLEAIYFGIPTQEQEKKIMDWISGRRIVEDDKYGSQGDDIYYFEFAPRLNTYSEENQFDTGIFVGHYSMMKNVKYGKTQIQNGGTSMHLSFYDLFARVRNYGADDAYSRLETIMNWYKKIYDYYVTSSNYKVKPDRFYWDYFRNGQWEKDPTIIPQNGNKGTAEGVTGMGLIGIDGEFLESLLTLDAIPYGFFGLNPLNSHTIEFNPSLPSSLNYWKMENLQFNFVKYDLTMFKNGARIDSVRGNAEGLECLFNFAVSKNNPKVYVNGKEIFNYSILNGTLSVSVPMQSCEIEIR